jgi:hypothetical protein
MNEYDLLLTTGQTNIKPLQTKIMVDLVRVVAIKPTRENVSEPVLLCCGHKRIEYELPLFALAGVERHDF